MLKIHGFLSKGKVDDAKKIFNRMKDPITQEVLSDEVLDVLEESVRVDEVANAIGSAPGNIAGVSDNQPPKQQKFAGCALFDVGSDAYSKCINGRNKYERWERKLNMEDASHSQIREYARRNPGKPIIVRDSKTGAMSYLIHKS